MRPSQHDNLPLLQASKAETIQLFFFFASCAALAMMLFRNIASLALLNYATQAQAATNYTSESLNPQLTNSIGNKGGPTLYYNGSGPVPP